MYCGDGGDGPRIVGEVAISGFTFPQVSTRLNLADIFGSFRARWSSARMNYAVEPGLYAVGRPTADSPVLVSANYKMSFDRLRKTLSGLDLWILVIDTKGINVWCAAGKGTFGTEELVGRIAQVGLGSVVRGRDLILPQLGAPGVAAHEVLRRSGFNVVYGPARAVDIPEFLRAGQKTTPSMRAVRFNLWDRLILTPIELAGVLKPALIILGILFVITLVRGGSAPFSILLGKTAVGFVPFLGAILAGVFFTPLLLPVIPGRAFAWKGWLLGLAWTVLYLRLTNSVARMEDGPPLSSSAAPHGVIPGDELHRGLDLHVSFRSGQRNEDRPSAAGHLRRSRDPGSDPDAGRGLIDRSQDNATVLSEKRRHSQPEP